MKDDLLKKFFSLLYTEKIIQKEDYELLITMLLSTLTLESLYNKNFFSSDDDGLLFVWC